MSKSTSEKITANNIRTWKNPIIRQRRVTGMHKYFSDKLGFDIDNVPPNILARCKNLIDQQYKETSLYIKEIEKELGFSRYVLRKILKKYLPSYLGKLRYIANINKGRMNKKVTEEDIANMVILSAAGYGIATIGTLSNIDAPAVSRYLKQSLGEDLYRKRHYKGRLGGRFGRTYKIDENNIVHSLGEYKIASKLIEKNINFQTQVTVPYVTENDRKTQKFVDFYLPDFDLYIEYTGMRDLSFYVPQVLKKIELYRKLNKKFIYFYDLKDAFTFIDFLEHNREILLDPTNICLPLSNDGIFNTTQGEGLTQGYVATFVRLSYCNLHCSWCDAYYTWQPEYVNHKEPPNVSPVLNILEKVKEFEHIGANPNYRGWLRAVITGGEPLLFQDKLEVLVFYLLISGYDVEIETNGTIVPSLFLQRFCQFNVSPKLSNNLNDPKKRRIIPKAINTLKKCKKVQFKFVVSKLEDWDEIQNDYIKPFNIDEGLICLMPEGDTWEKLDKTRHTVIKLCLDNKIRYSDRFQIIAWGNKRGV